MKLSRILAGILLVSLFVLGIVCVAYGQYADYDEVTAKYNPEELNEGFNTMPDGEEIFYISNPALGLWAFKDRFEY